MLTLPLVYLAGLISGVILTVLTLTAWVLRAAAHIKQRRTAQHGPSPRTGRRRTATAHHRANGHHRRRIPVAAAP